MDDHHRGAQGGSSSPSRKRVFRQFRVEVGRLSGRDGEVPGVGKKVTCPQLNECGAGKFSEGQLVGAGKGLGRSEGFLRRLGRGAAGGAEVFGEQRHLATGSLNDSLVARYDIFDEGLHIPFRTRRGRRQLITDVIVGLALQALSGYALCGRQLRLCGVWVRNN
jgi:hypothetical protein